MLDDGFAVCWQCGTDQRGTPDPNFTPEIDGADDEAIASTRPRQFSLKFLFLFTTIAGLIVGLVNAPGRVSFIFWAVVAANILGLIVGLFATHVLRFPNDGSLTWHDQDLEN